MKWFRRILVAIVLIVVVLTAGVAWLVRQTSRPPEWYAPLDPASPEVAAVGERVEYGVVEEFQRIRPDEEPWTLRLHEEQLNAWLAARLPAWIAHDASTQWPAGVGTPQLRLSEAGLELAVGVAAGDRERVVVARLVPEVENGMIRLEIDRVGLGRVALPGAATDGLLAAMGEMAPGAPVDADAANEVLSMLTGAAGEAADGGIILADGRRVELLEVLLADGSIDLTSRTRKPGQPADDTVAPDG